MKDEWLSQHLGKPVYDVSKDRVIIVSENNSMYYCKTNNIERVESLMRNGFELVSTQILLWRKAGRIVCHRLNDYTFHTEDWGQLNFHLSEKLLEIAENSFNNDRFHSDRHISSALARLLKRKWVENYLNCNRVNGHFFPIKNGFLCALKQDNIAVIDLIAVHQDHRNKNLGLFLLDCFSYYYCHYEPCDEFQVGTQLNNIGAVNFYTRHGFKFKDYQYVLHKHT